MGRPTTTTEDSWGTILLSACKFRIDPGGNIPVMNINSHGYVLVAMCLPSFQERVNRLM